MNDKTAFFKHVKPWLPNLKNYISARLKRTERNGLIPKNMYVASDISDEILVHIYEKENDIIHDEKKVKARAFALATKRMDELVKKEEELHKKEIPLGQILDNELRFMNEAFTTDADGDLMPVEELDDISYHLEDYKPHLFLASDDTRREIYRTLGITEEEKPEDKAVSINRFLQKLPEESQNIFELRSYGLLNTEEIAEVLSLEKEKVEAVFFSIQKAYKRFG